MRVVLQPNPLNLGRSSEPMYQQHLRFFCTITPNLFTLYGVMITTILDTVKLRLIPGSAMDAYLAPWPVAVFAVDTNFFHI